MATMIGTRRVACGLCGFVLASSVAPVAVAQETAPSLAPVSSSSPPPNDNPEKASLDVGALGVSLDRIRAQSRRGLFDNAFDPGKLELSTYVDVTAKAPPIRLFGPDARRELTSRAVPYGPPVHQEMINIVTPQEFRIPPVDLTALIDWFARETVRKDADQK